MSYEQYNFLAQVFTVSDSTGIYLTSVDLFFSTKDDTIPVTVQLRTVSQGVPSNVVIPLSEVTLRPKDVTTSPNASVPTRFTFPSPVYLSGPSQQDLRGNGEIDRLTSDYSLVVFSGSQRYGIFTASIGSQDNTQNENISISNSPSIGSLFKPKTTGVWESSRDQILKFSLNRASFQSEGIARFFNPTLEGLSFETVTSSNSFLTLSKKILVGLSSSNYNKTEVVPGVTIVQENASGILAGIAGSIATGVGIGITIINVGSGFTTGTYSNISLVSQTGLGQGAVATIGVVTTGISTVTVTNGGFGYTVGDVLTIGDISGNAGYGVRLGISSISESNSFIIDNINGGTFSSGISTIKYKNSSNVTTNLGIGTDIFINTIYEDPFYDGLHMKVNHVNHDMNSYENYVKISKFYPLTTEVHSKVTTEILPSSNSITLESTTGFENFEDIAVDATNLGYIIIGDEVISYTGISGNTLTGVTRAIDAPLIPNTTFSYGIYPIGTYVYKYELKGISLRRINKIHKLSEVNNITNHPIDIDSYYIKIETSDTDFDGKQIGKNRLGSLFFSETSLTGDYGTHISQNIQYSSIYPTIKYILPTSTNIQGRVRTFSGTSSNGNENSFEDLGYTEINLNRTTNFNTPRIIASRINEEKNITDSPGNRSFDMELVLTTQDDRVSPLIDLEELSVKLGSYRLNQPISLNSYMTDDRIRGLTGDPNACIYISKPVYLKFASNSLKVLLSAYTGSSGDIRVLYRLFNSGNPELSSNYEPFPGYKNYQVDSNGIKRVIDPSLNDGTSDSFVNVGSSNEVYDYEYTADDLQYFDGFSIKVIISGTNQADVPYLKDIRAIANIKPQV